MITLRTDTVSRKKRSQIMSAVRSTGNKATEAVFITILRKGGISGWRRQFRLRGKPDFVFPKQRTAIFVDGCFWHGCTKHCRMPKGNSGYWKPKISRNKAVIGLSLETCVAQAGEWCAYGNTSFRQDIRSDYRDEFSRRCSDYRFAPRTVRL
jgi:DNA mismatch endonuclease Vsr